ncbi:MAG: GHKL domain-containing protein [Lachnospiraceae bacterium]|nr:GHKL domain-containing protein [Lachnospiraceae bacterium]
MLSVLYNLSFLLDAFLLHLYYQALFDKRKNSVPLPLYVLSFATGEFAFSLATGFLVGDTSLFAVYIRTTLGMTVNFLLSLFYQASIVYCLLAAACYTVFSGFCEDLTYWILQHFTGINLERMDLPESSFMAISLISCLLLFFFILLLDRLWKWKSGIHSVSYTLLLLLTPLLSLGLSLSPACFSLNYTFPDLYLTLSVFLLILNVTNYILLGNTQKTESLERKTEQLEKQISYQSQKYVQLGEAYRNIRRFMHDARKHLFFIEQCVKEGNYDRIIPYSRETIEDLESRYCTVNTGNLVIDAFISNFMLQTARSGIELSTDLKIDRNLFPVNDYHLMIILGNLLDNAINACSRESSGRIDIKIQTVENTFTIYIANTCHLSSVEKKPNKIDEIDFIHGYGLQNVKNSVAECGGILVTNYENNLYSVTAIFPL